MNEKTKNEKMRSVIISNDATLGRQQMTIKEAKILRIAISYSKKIDNDFFEREIDATAVARMLDIDKANIRRDLEQISRRLFNRSLEIKDENSDWEMYHWFQRISFKKNILSFRLNDIIKPFILQLENNFLKYDLDTAMLFSSKYAMRIYEIIKSLYGRCEKSKTTFEISLKELREMTNTEEKYKKIGKFKEKVLDVAMKEITEYTDIILSYKAIRLGRNINSFVFYLTEKQMKPDAIKFTNPVSPQNIEDIQKSEDLIPGQIDCKDIYKIQEMVLSNNIPCTFRQAEQLFKAYDNTCNENFKSALNATIKKIKAGKVKQPIGYLLTIGKNGGVENTIKTNNYSNKKNKANKKNDNKLSPERKQAYLDMEVEFAEDLWPDLPDVETPNTETIAAIQEVEEMERNPDNHPGFESVDDMLKKLV